MGVASSVCIILIALLAFFVLRRRKQRRARALPHHGHDPDAKELPAFTDDHGAPPLPEKHWSAAFPPPIEADTRTIYELDAAQVPQLPELAHVPGAQELDGAIAEPPAAESKQASASARPSEGPRDVPTLHISPPEMSPLSSSSLLGVSPLSVSPLEDAYFAQSPREPRSPQAWI